MAVTVGLLGLLRSVFLHKPVRNSVAFFRQPARTRKYDTKNCFNTVFFFDTCCLTTRVTVDVLLQPDMLLIGLSCVGTDWLTWSAHKLH